jgi:hypothetical protein
MNVQGSLKSFQTFLARMDHGTSCVSNLSDSELILLPEKLSRLARHCGNPNFIRHYLLIHFCPSKSYIPKKSFSQTYLHFLLEGNTAKVDRIHDRWLVHLEVHLSIHLPINHDLSIATSFIISTTW